MQTPGAENQKAGNDNSLWVLLGLCAIAASTMAVEVVLTKFVAYKVFHHFINAIISTVILSFGAAGTWLYLTSGKQAQSADDTWRSASREAMFYAVTLVAMILLFCWLPIDPYQAGLPLFWKVLSVPIYFLILSIPFFFAGLCISRVLAQSTVPATRVYFFDLLAAAIAAALSPPLLDVLGGYGLIGLASFLAVLGYFAFLKASRSLSLLKIGGGICVIAALTALLCFYPGWAIKEYGFDIRSAKAHEVRDLIYRSFHGLQNTYWNALARIDVSNTGLSNSDSLVYGISPNSGYPKLEGRLIMADCGASTRQLKATGDLFDQKFLADMLWASPYVIKSDAKDSLVLGVGGGIDILVAKYYRIPRLDVVELNPMTYKHLLRGEGDPEAASYQPWLVSNETTKVTIINKEGRHFCSTQPANTYDVIQANGADTLTAVASGALAFSDNYLYTFDAVKSYARLLKPGGVLSLSHFRFSNEPPALTVRMFLTFLRYLESTGNKEAYKNVMVIGSNWSDTILKTTPFTQEELERVRKWCAASGNVLLFDPGRHSLQAPGVSPSEEIYSAIGFADPQKREKILAEYVRNVEPVTDDKPYFYHVEKGENFFFSWLWASAPMVVVYATALFALLLAGAPLLKLRKSKISANTFYHGAYFALCGFAFLLFEVSIVQLFSVFVGGPTYALAVVLVSVLGGYSIGCLLADKLSLRPKTFVLVGVALFLLNIVSCFALPRVIDSLLSLELPARIVSCVVITLLLSVVSGIPVSLAMEAVKRSHPAEVAWLWGVSSAFNALASVCFVLISHRIGIAATLSVVAVLYLSACLLFARFGPFPSSKTG